MERVWVRIAWRSDIDNGTHWLFSFTGGRTPLTVKRLRSLATEVRAGLHFLGVPELPSWARVGDKYSGAIAKRFALWAREDARQPARAALRRVVLPSRQIESFCFDIAGKILSGELYEDCLQGLWDFFFGGVPTGGF